MYNPGGTKKTQKNEKHKTIKELCFSFIATRFHLMFLCPERTHEHAQLFPLRFPVCLLHLCPSLCCCRVSKEILFNVTTQSNWIEITFSSFFFFFNNMVQPTQLTVICSNTKKIGFVGSIKRTHTLFS